MRQLSATDAPGFVPAPPGARRSRPVDEACSLCGRGACSIAQIGRRRAVVRAAGDRQEDELSFLNSADLDVGDLELDEEDLGARDQLPVEKNAQNKANVLEQGGKLSDLDDQTAFQSALDSAWSSLEASDFSLQDAPGRTRRQKKQQPGPDTVDKKSKPKSNTDDSTDLEAGVEDKGPELLSVSTPDDDLEDLSLDDDDTDDGYEIVEDNPKWYFLIIRTMMEDTVRIALENMLRNVPSLRTKLLDVLLPVKKLRKYNKAGRRMDRNDKVFPGYLLLNAQLDEELYNALKAITHVQGFVADPNLEKKKKDPWRRPEPLSAAEVKRIFAAIEENEAAEPPRELSFKVGDLVTITAGAFKGSDGNIKSVNDDGKVTVEMVVFGKQTNIDLEFSEVTSPNFL